MIIRRAFYYALFPAALVLPAWSLVGWGLFGNLGWELLGVMLGAGVLAIAMLGLSGIIVARASVRQNKAVSWIDAGILTLLYAAVIGLGFYTSYGTLLIVGTVLSLIALFWLSIGQLFVEARRRMQSAFAAYDRPTPPQAGGYSSPRIDGEYIVIETGKTASQ